MKSFSLEEQHQGKRLDEVVFSLGITLSRSKASALIKEGKVRVNGKQEKAHYLCEAGDLLEAEEAEARPLNLAAQDIPLDVVYEDDDILILNKPAGMLVHPGNGHEDGTIVNALLYRGLDLPSGSEAARPGIVHRIDKDTSGLLAIAKTEEAMLSLSKQLSTHSMHREYLALVKGIILEDQGKIDAPIGRDKLVPTRNAVDVRGGKESVTYFTVKKRYKRSDVTLVSCRLLTGRTHQIRVHMDYIGHPVIGDLAYGSSNRKLYNKGQLLHAYRLTLVHPKTGEEMSFEAPLPSHFEKILATLDEEESR